MAEYTTQNNEIVYFVDFACSGHLYLILLCIRMMKVRTPFLSPHKFLGGPGTKES